MTWVLMPSGAEVSLVQPAPETFRLDDILSGLTFLTRFSGAAGQYTVADHSLGCYDYATDRGWPAYMRAACLVHDFHEAYFGDITSPTKHAIGYDIVRAAESRVELALARWLVPFFRLELHKAQVLQADLALLLAERQARFETCPTPWPLDERVTDAHRSPLRYHTRKGHLVTAMHELARNGVKWGDHVDAQLRDEVAILREMEG